MEEKFKELEKILDKDYVAKKLHYRDEVIANKEHKCKLCDGMIHKGELYLSSHFAKGKRHIRCQEDEMFALDEQIKNHNNAPIYRLKKELLSIINGVDSCGCGDIVIKDNVLKVSTCGEFEAKECFKIMDLANKYNPKVFDRPRQNMFKFVF